MATFENEHAAFTSSLTSGTVPRWQRKALEARNDTPKTPKADRFIPNRGSMNLDACHYNLTAQGETPEDYSCSPSKAEMQRSLKNNLFDNQSSKILAFKNKAPAPREGFQSECRVLYTQAKAAAKTKSTRHIPQTADRILDAPELRSDFYLNLMDWGASNTIAVALGETVYLWNATTGGIEELYSAGSAENYVSSVSWLDDGVHLAIGSADSTVQIWDASQQKRIRTMRGHEGRIAALSWNQHILSSGDKAGHVFNNDVRVQDHVVARMAGHAQEVCGLKWSPDGKYLASGGNDNIVNIWNANGSLAHRLTEHQAAVKALAWCPWQSNLLATGGGTADRQLRFYNAASGSLLNTIDTRSQISSIVWNKEHREIMTGHGFSDNQLSIWKYPTMQKVADLTGHSQRVLSMALSPDGTTVVSAAGDETLRFWKCFARDEKKKAKKAAGANQTRLSAMIR